MNYYYFTIATFAFTEFSLFSVCLSLHSLTLKENVSRKITTLGSYKTQKRRSDSYKAPSVNRGGRLKSKVK